MKIYLDPGHGGTDAGAAGNGLKEKDVTLAIAKHIRSILTGHYKHVTVKMSRTNDKTVSLKQRTNEANNWKADYFLSIHCNSFNGSAKGFESYIHSSLSNSSQTASNQNELHKAVLKPNQLKDRGQRKDNLHVLRESAMPALLTENGFIDNKHDAAFMKDDSWRKKVAQGHVHGLAEAFHLKRKPSKSENAGSQSTYRVIAGSFDKKANAKARVSLLQKADINSFVDTVTIAGKQGHRVQAGTYERQKNAASQLRKVKHSGVEDAYIKRDKS